MAAVCIAGITAQEQATLRKGTYVRLHGLSNKQYNGQEGYIVSKLGPKAEVFLANENKHIRTSCKNLSWMPTFRVSRCKLRPHQTVHLSTPVFKQLPDKLTGTFYDMLGVNKHATGDEIRAAFKKKSVQFHPDKNTGQEERATALFQQILEAYECLTDVNARQVYDQKQGFKRPWSKGSTPSKFQCV